MSLTVGVIYVAYQAEDLVPRSLTPWIRAKAQGLGGHEYYICAVSVPFTGFDHGTEPLDKTRSLLGLAAHQNDIDHGIVTDKPMAETEARGRALVWLRDKAKVDLTIQWDADEIATTDELGRIVSFADANPWASLRLSYRNAVFDEHTYLVEPFTPMRIHRMRVGGYEAHSFWDDNNVLYRHVINQDHYKRDVEMATMTVPTTIAHPRHLTWSDSIRSRRKIEYQTKARGWECSFRWDDLAGRLCFNETYYAKRGLPIPEVIHE